MSKTVGAIVASAGVLSLAAFAHAQAGTGGTVASGAATFTMAVSPTVGTGVGTASADLRPAGGVTTDHLYQNWWWYRVNGVDIRENCLFNAASPSWSGNTGQLSFTTASFTAVARWVLTEQAAGSPKVEATLAVTNTTGAPLDIALFSYTDFDVNATAAGDAATLAPANTVVIADAGTNAYFRGVNANAYQVATFTAVRTNLSDGDIDNFASTGLPFTGADWTAGWQYNRVIPVGGTATVKAVFGIGTPPPECPRDFNNVGGVTVQDLYDFFTDWNSQIAGGPIIIQTADINGSGSITVQDLYDYLTLWQNGCP